MSIALPFAGVGELTSSPTESRAFGFDVARLSIGGAWSREVENGDELACRVAALLGGANEQTVIVRYPSELVEIARLEAPGGRRMQHAGTLLYWEDPSLDEAGPDDAEVGGGEAIVHSGSGAVPFGFLEAASAVVADSFDGYLNHYAYNTRIPAALARDGYVDWARRTIADPAGAAILLRDGDEATAVATLRLHGDAGRVVADVELASVASAWQGAGRYAKLWKVIRRTARDAGAGRLIISTQASNIRVQRAWARLGLLPLASFDTLHAVADAG